MSIGPTRELLRFLDRMSDVAKILLCGVLGIVPSELSDALDREFTCIARRHAIRDWQPSELNGGRFAEAVLRFLEWRQKGQYTPLGTKPDRSKILSSARNDVSLPDSYRSILPSCVDILMDVRNHRDVAHLGTDVDVNEMDARLLRRVSSWVLAEIVREEASVPPVQVQSLIDVMSARQLPIVEEIDGQPLVLDTKLSARERALVALYHRHPESMSVACLQKAVQYRNVTRFREILRGEVTEARVWMSGDSCRLTSKGAAWVEANIDLHLAL